MIPFEIGDKIGVGGMGEIWRGRHRGTGVEVAVKFISELAEADDARRAMFRAEVRAHAGLGHPGIVRVLDYGELDQADERTLEGRFGVGSPYLVTQFAPGGSLAEALPLNAWSEVLDVLGAILDALAFAHARGVIHRDLKPANILRFPDIDGPGRIQLADFGIAHAVFGDRRVQQDGSMPDEQPVAASAGTPHYMAPEQWRGRWRRFGQWTDLYQVGVLAWQLVSGRPPFEASSLSRLGIAHMTKPLPPLEPRFAVPEHLPAWIAHMTEKQPELRYRRAADAAWNLARLEDPAAAASSSPRGAVEPAAFAHTVTLPDVDADFADTRFDAQPTTLREVRTDAPTSPVQTRPSIETRIPFDSLQPPRVASAEQISRVAEPAPTPSTWRTRRHTKLDIPLAGAGVGLFGLREVPFVDRDEARDAIWRKVLEAVDGATCGVLIEGPSGVGKSRLAQWIAQRADEVGACQILRAFHNPQGGRSDGLVGMIEDFFGSWELDRAQLYEQIRERLHAEALVWSDSDLAPDRDARALAELLRPSADASSAAGPAYRFSSREEQFALLSRLLGYAARRRPVLAWIDDVQWAQDALGWLEFVVDHGEQLGVAFVLTARIDELAPMARQTLQRARDISEDAAFERISLRPLSAAHHSELIARTLALEPELADLVAQRTEGNPLFAIQLVGDWIERDALAAGEDGFALAEDAREAVPDAIRELWARRIEYLLAALPAAEQHPARLSLEIAAALGREVDMDDWEQACRQAGARPLRRLVERLDEAGLATSRPGRWRFVHGLLVDTLEQMARSAGRWADHHRVCARMLAAQPARRPVAVHARRAAHLEAAGDLAEAIAPLGEAVRAARQSVDIKKARALNARQLRLIDDLGLPADDPRRLHNRLERADLTSVHDTEQAKAQVDRLRPAFEKLGDPEPLLRICLLEAQLAIQRGDLEEVRRVMEEARNYADRSSRDLRATYERATGHTARIMGDYGRAREHYLAAKKLYEQSGLHGRALQTESDIIYVDSEMGEHQRAFEQAEVLLDRARRQGDVHAESQALTCLGEAAGHLERWDEAVDYFTRGLELDRSVANRAGEAIQLLNVGLAYIGTGAYGPALEHLEAAEELFAAVGMTRLGPLVQAGLVACDAASSNWTSFDARLDRAEAALAASESRAANQAWVFGLAADAARRAGRPDRQRRLLELERRVWRDLERPEEVARVSEALSDA